MIDGSLLFKSLPSLLSGALVSIQIAAISSSIGFVLGTVLGVLQSNGNKLIRILIGIYVTIFRGTPMLVQLTIIYFVLPQFGIHISAIGSAIIAIGLNSGAYVSQIIRSGISSVSYSGARSDRLLAASPGFILLIASNSCKRSIARPHACNTARPRCCRSSCLMKPPRAACHQSRSRHCWRPATPSPIFESPD